MYSILFEDGKGNLVNEEGVEVSVIEMEVDEIEYPLHDITNYGSCLDLKPPEKLVKTKQEAKECVKEAETQQESSDGKKSYRSYKPDVKNYFFYLVYEKNKSIRSAAAELKVPQITAKGWIKKAKQAGYESLEETKAGSGRPVSRPPVLTEDHREFLTNLVGEKPSLVLEEMVESLTSQFSNLHIPKSAVHSFITEKCNVSVKRAHFHAIVRNNPDKIEVRYNWVKL
jgi:transposase